MRSKFSKFSALALLVLSAIALGAAAIAHPTAGMLAMLPILPLGMVFHAPETGARAGGAKTLTLEEQLTEARNDLQTARTTLSAVTTERDTANSALTQARADITSRDTQINTLTGERDTARTNLSTVTGERDTARTNLSRLEKLAGVHGISLAEAPPIPANGPAGGAPEHVLDRYIAAKGTAKAELFRDHKAAIRAEQHRRKTAANV